MRTIRRIAILWRNLFRRSRVEQDLDDELRAYIEMAIEEKRQAGMAAADARRAVLMEVGAADAVKEGVRDVRLGTGIETMAQDVRYGLRMLRKSPGFTTLAVLSLALGIGATTAIYSLMEALLLRPLTAVLEPDRLMKLTRPEAKSNFEWFTWLESEAFQQQAASVLSGVGAFGHTTTLALHDGSATATAEINVIGGDYFGALRLHAQLGRLLSPDDDQKVDGPPAAVLSDACWRRRFGASRGVLGREITIGGLPFIIVGVAARGFRGLNFSDRPDVFVPASMRRAMNPYDELSAATGRPFAVCDPWALFARLKPGVNAARAEAVLNTIAARPEKGCRDRVTARIVLEPATASVLYVESRRREIRHLTRVLLAAAGVALLIACVNVAGLLLVRTQERRREMAVRLSLGATPQRLARQLLTEGLLLAVLGGTAGALACTVILAAVGGLALPGTIQVSSLDIRFNARMLGVSTLVGVATGLLFSLVPAWAARRFDLVTAMKAPGTSGHRLSRGGGLLLVAQIALCLPLLVGTALLLRTLHSVLNSDPHLDSRRILTVTLPGTRPAHTDALLRALLERARRWPQIAAVDVANTDNAYVESALWVDGQRRDVHATYWYAVGPAYRDVMNLRLLKGRWLDSRDVAGAPRVAVVNQALAEHLWPGENPIGRRFAYNSPPFRAPDTLEVVGVVANIRQNLHREQRTYSYVAMAQQDRVPDNRVHALFVRAKGDPVAVVATLRSEVRALDPTLAAPRIRPWIAYTRDRLGTHQLAATLLGLFSSMGLVLAAAGVYGLFAYSIARRTPELGVRIALGADRRQILGLVLRQGAFIIGAGLAAGTLLSFWCVRLIAGLLRGVTATDPFALAAASVLLALAGLLACYIPARRASRVNPTIALRYE